MNQARTALLSTVAAGALCLALGRPAHAQMAVFDSASFGQLLNAAQNGARQLSTLENQLTKVTDIDGLTEQNLQQLTSFYQSFAHITNASQVAPLLVSDSASFPLPELAQVEGLLRGQGFTGSLASQAQQILSQIQRYKPVGADFAATQMNTRAQATAGTMATAQTLFSSAEQRQQGMAQLMSSLATSADPKQSMDLAARASIENGYAQSQANQAAALSIMQRSQEDAQQEQAEQQWRQGADSLVQSATSAAGSGS